MDGFVCASGKETRHRRVPVTPRHDTQGFV
ncbi:hypothetical protein CGRA01v4_05673 [Colletotrichum graminicola]|nr:hypothetical protein CGRA01v4_05673 [Colletotrichum graminicola]